jgi:molybdenum cofactor synthesis domain-containing protein
MITAAVLTVSDSVTEGTREDRSGPAVAEELRVRGFEVVSTGIVSDVEDLIEESLRALCAMAQLVVTTGGTGISEKDVTPEATRAVCSKLIDGIAEKMRADGLAATPTAILSRGVCGVYEQSLILNLPGSPSGAIESLAAVADVLPHAIDLLAGRTDHEESIN